MTYEEKNNKFWDRDWMEWGAKTSFEDLPLEFKYAGSWPPPDEKGNMTTSDIVLWVRFSTMRWFQPYGRFNQAQIKAMIELCHNDNQVIALFELLSAKESK